MEALRFTAHYGTHFIVPVLIAYLCYRKSFKQSLIILWAGILIDIDHLLVTPIFDSMRCSIGFHPLHSYWAIGIYFILLIPQKIRIFGLALVIHILADRADCLFI